jgi:hypothetical protein
MFGSPSNFSYDPRSSVPRRSLSALHDWPLTAKAQPPLHDPRAQFARTPGLGEIRHEPAVLRGFTRFDVSSGIVLTFSRPYFPGDWAPVVPF